MTRTRLEATALVYDVGVTVRELRRAKGLSQMELAPARRRGAARHIAPGARGMQHDPGAAG